MEAHKTRRSRRGWKYTRNDGRVATVERSAEEVPHTKSYPPTPPPPLDPADRVENERTRQLRRRLGDAAYERVYAICRRAHERCTAVRKRDLFEVVAQGDYDACLAVEQLVFADIVRSTSSRQRAATLE